MLEKAKQSQVSGQAVRDKTAGAAEIWAGEPGLLFSQGYTHQVHTLPKSPIIQATTRISKHVSPPSPARFNQAPASHHKNVIDATKRIFT